tara:strand:+ start:1091 stop:1567 length:477 start_codon:yes stop_codon:yes gene_type:complete
MAHFAELDATNTVLRVIAVHNDVTTIDGAEDEQRGVDFLDDLYPESGTWVQTSYNSNARNRYAGVGSTYDNERDVFIPPAPFPSWVLDDDTLEWEPPSPPPNAGYVWDEDTTAWVKPPAPFPSWNWVEHHWEASEPYPGTPEDFYEWDEDTTSWVEVE